MPGLRWIGGRGFHTIALAGDSAGGGLALATIASGAVKTRVVAAVVFSPWLDLALTGETMESRADVDPILSRTSLQQAVNQYLAGGDVNDARANAMAGGLVTLPPFRIDVGDNEVLLDDSLRFYALADAVRQTSCELHIWKGMLHVFPANIAMLKAATEALNGFGDFLKQALHPGNAA